MELSEVAAGIPFHRPSIPFHRLDLPLLGEGPERQWALEIGVAEPPWAKILLRQREPPSVLRQQPPYLYTGVWVEAGAWRCLPAPTQSGPAGRCVIS